MDVSRKSSHNSILDCFHCVTSRITSDDMDDSAVTVAVAVAVAGDEGEDGYCVGEKAKVHVHVHVHVHVMDTND